jgi:hypothetical protein
MQSKFKVFPHKVIPIFIAGVLCVLATACGHEFDGEAIQMGAGKLVELDREQVSMSYEQLVCGIKNELWEGDSTESGQPQTSYRLTQKGRDLQFSDDVYPNGASLSTPYTQVRGKFRLQLGQVTAITNGSDHAKLVQAKLSVKIPHPCFATALPIMGVRKGKFAPDAAPVLKYEEDESGWQLTELVH